MTEKRLHIQVAVALGWTACQDGCMYHPPGVICDGTTTCREAATGEGIMARYDTDWFATGPLIERYKIDLSEEGREKPLWGATAWHLLDEQVGWGETPLIAVCHLILALAASVVEAISPPSEARP